MEGTQWGGRQAVRCYYGAEKSAWLGIEEELRFCIDGNPGCNKDIRPDWGSAAVFDNIACEE